jgi:hypothetical protein
VPVAGTGVGGVPYTLNSKSETLVLVPQDSVFHSRTYRPTALR